MRKIVLTLISIVALGALVACGGSSSSSSNVISVPPAPTGGNPAGFSNTSLSGNYVFTANGVNTGNGSNFVVAGVFTANGNGGITAGTRDTVNNAGGQTLGEAIVGTYTVNADGRGLMVLQDPNGSNPIIYCFVLSSPSAGSLFQEASGSTSVAADAIGRIEKQTTGTAAASGTYVVRLDGADTTNTPYGAVGGLVITSAAGTVTGQIDENDGGNFSNLPVTSGAISLPGSRGNASFALSTTGTHSFVVYYVSPNRLELISTNTNFLLHGYADLQTSFAANNSNFSGNQVFNLSGYDTVGSIEETGHLFLDGLGNVPAGAIKDYNENLTFYPAVQFSGTYNVTGSTANGLANGRWTAPFSGFSSGPIVNEGIVGWQVSSGQSLVLVTSGSAGSGYRIVETGDMRAQTLSLTNASITGNYAQAFSGYSNSLGDFESTGNYFATNGALSGTIDFQTDANGFTQNSPQTNSSYIVDPLQTTGRGTANVSGVPVIFYPVDATSIYMISSDGAYAYQGTLTQQPQQ